MTIAAPEIAVVAKLGRADLLATSRLLAAVGMRRRKPAELARAIAASATVVVARDAGALVGFGRMISDGVYYGSLWDIAVSPTHQHRGIGAAIVERLLAAAKQRKLYMLGLVTAPHNFEFYRRDGFTELLDVHAMVRTRKR